VSLTTMSATLEFEAWLAAQISSAEGT
jgi:hypothetical protein